MIGRDVRIRDPGFLSMLGGRRVALAFVVSGFFCLSVESVSQGDPLRQDRLPKHVTPATLVSVKKALDFLAKSQSGDGSWSAVNDGAAYPLTMTALAGMAFLANGNTPTRGPYADSVRRAMRFLMKQTSPAGLLIGHNGGNGRPMYGHGFSMLFLSCVYGMETDPAIRKRLATILIDAMKMTSRAQSPLGGWTYTPGSGDEGSVTVTQMQGLRAAHNAGFTVPNSTIERAIRYLEACRTPEGGIRYSYGSANTPNLAISAAAIACLYSAGEYDSRLAVDCLNYVAGAFNKSGDGFNLGGHSFYMNLYAAQAFYQAGDDYWDDYFPKARDHFIKQQNPDGSWSGGSVGATFSTSIASIILQLPYKFLPIYQR